MVRREGLLRLLSSSICLSGSRRQFDFVSVIDPAVSRFVPVGHRKRSVLRPIQIRLRSDRALPHHARVVEFCVRWRASLRTVCVPSERRGHDLLVESAAWPNLSHTRQSNKSAMWDPLSCDPGYFVPVVAASGNARTSRNGYAAMGQSMSTNSQVVRPLHFGQRVNV